MYFRRRCFWSKFIELVLTFDARECSTIHGNLQLNAIMKRFLLIPLFCLFSGCYSPQRNCTDFKTGTFVFETYLNGEMVKTKFTRNDTLEIDYFRNQVDSSSIRWINDCEYILTNLHPKNMEEEKPLHIKILTTEENTYTFEFSVVGSANKQLGTAKKIE